MLDHMVALFLVSMRNLHTTSHRGGTSLCSHQQCVRVLFFVTFLSAFLICIIFDDSHSDRCEVIAHCGFDFHSPDD